MSAEIQKFQAILSRLLASNQKFTDEEFAPNPTVSIGGPYSKYPFRRASEILDHVAIFPQDITPTDIRQGLLSDSYLLSGIAALAEEPALVERLFLTEESNKAGLYAIWLCDNGVWRPILLDDHFPCKQYSGAYFPAFAQCHTGEIWIPLMEKAYAKINGSYFNIESGFPHHVLRDLTGAPTEELYDESDLEKIWDFLSRGMDNEYFLMCTTELLEDEKESEGLPKGHAYTVLDAREVQTDSGPERLILVRNPWSTFEWKGAWSKTSNLWTPNLRTELNYPEDEEDSLFWMNLEDYQKYFPISWVCKYKKNNNYYSVSFDHRNNNNNVLRIKVRERQEVTISLNQRDRRFFKNTPHPDYFYSYARILLAKSTKNGLEYITGNASGFERNLQATHTLEPGTYLLTIEVNWNQKHWNEFNVSFYSEGRLEIESLAQVDLLAIQKNIIKSAIGKVETNKTVTNYGRYGDGQLTKTVDSLHGIFYFHYENRSRKKSKLCETIKFSQVNNLRICSPFTNDHQFEVSVLPGSDVLVLYKAVLDDYSWGYSASFFIQTASPEEEKIPANTYKFVDNPNNKAKIDVNENYNTHIKEELENEEDDQEADDTRRTGPRDTEQSRRSRPRGQDDYEEEKGDDDEEEEEDTRSQNRSGRRPAKNAVVQPKEFPVTVMTLGQTNSKKIKYTNYDNVDKQLVITSTHPDIIQVKEPKMFVRAGESADVRLRFYAPRQLGYYDVKLEIRLGKSPKVEEVLLFPIENRADY